MKKQIIAGMVVIACAALCAAVWPRSAGDGKVPAEPVKDAVNAKIEAGPEETQPIFLSDDTYANEPRVAEESELAGTEGITTEEKTEITPAEPTKTVASTKPYPNPSLEQYPLLMEIGTFGYPASAG